MWTWIIGTIVFAIIGFAGYHVFKDRKNGTGCGCSCENCRGCPKSESLPKTIQEKW